jgi:aerobic carbon-monoxide dehydrogenase small subunit
MEATVRTRVSLTVNGVAHEDEIEPRLLLVHYLRDVLGLTGTHVGCDTSQCGACTVHLDGLAVKSCTVLAASTDGSAVTTIEGLRPYGQLHPLQEAFWQEHGLQCGFCTPGIIMTAAGLLRENPTASEEEIREGLGGNLCRCTGYHNVVRAVQAVVWQMAHTTEMPATAPGDVIPPESLPGGILSSPTGADIKVPHSPTR